MESAYTTWVPGSGETQRKQPDTCSRAASPVLKEPRLARSCAIYGSDELPFLKAGHRFNRVPHSL